ncbi:hypothetical protein ZWY2020_010948 [Hordeum vulgare]|nr:hypothetical protein ZWY2020_010948 [Hordeum vulgare]
MASAGVPRRRYQGCSAMDADPRDHPRCSSLSCQAPSNFIARGPGRRNFQRRFSASPARTAMLRPPMELRSRRVDLCKAPPPPTLSGSAT